MKKMLSLIIGLCCVISFAGCSGDKMLADKSAKEDEQSHFEQDFSYGVFLGIDGESFDDNFERMAKYENVVIDADSLSKTQVEKLKESCRKVYSYIDVGSLENYRSYYQRFEDLKLDSYEGWPDEYWMDVSDKEWQSFILDEYAPRLIETGIDGFFVDNLDVYYHYQTDAIYDGCEAIMTGLKNSGLEVIGNGGDTYVREHLSRNSDDKENSDNKGISDILSGVNQEITEEEEVEYYKEYVELLSSEGATIYILEYTNSDRIKEGIRSYCMEHDFYLYISDSLDLS